MSDKHNDIINQIIEIELEMFLAVPSRDNSCQKDPKTFRLHRKVQFMPWSDKTLLSYLNDLNSARLDDRNLMTLKYTLMEDSSRIPGPDPLPDPLIEKIVACQLEWQKEMFLKYPRIMSRARPLEKSTSSAAMTSFKTYLENELKTYSSKTLSSLYQDITSKQKSSKNMAEETYELLAQNAGYPSLKEAEKMLSSS